MPDSNLVDALNSDERDYLQFLETQAVDGGGKRTKEGRGFERPTDQSSFEALVEAGLIADLEDTDDFADFKLSDLGWELAHKTRRKIAEYAYD